jgi:hypothetical protein
MKPLLFFGSIFLMGAIMIWHGASQWRAGAASKDWPEVSGKVTESYFRKQDRKHSLTYEYAVGGESLTGQRKQFGLSTYRALSDYEGLKVGDSVTVRHRPDSPSVSTLKTGAHPNVYFFLVGGLVFAVGSVIAFFKSM